MLNDLRDLGNQGLVNELAQVDLANAVDEAEVETTEVEVGQVHIAEDALLLDGEDGRQLLKLEEGVEVEVLGAKEVLESQDVKVVDLAELAETLEVEAVQGEEVVEVEVPEALEVVQLGEVHVGAGLVSCGGGGGEGGEGRDEDGGETHLDVWWVGYRG